MAQNSDRAPLISVVLATYNGAPFLREQLDSVLGQSIEDIEIVVRDDGSTDETVEILNSYCTDSRFRLLSDDRRLGAAKNFGEAAMMARGLYVAFSDQDDIWLPYKLERSL